MFDRHADALNQIGRCTPDRRRGPGFVSWTSLLASARLTSVVLAVYIFAMWLLSRRRLRLPSKCSQRKWHLSIPSALSTMQFRGIGLERWISNF